MSRFDLLFWVNSTLNTRINNIEDLCHGDAYCLILDKCYPGAVSLKSVKLEPRFKHEFVHNLKVLQNGFSKAKIDKIVPIALLVNCRFKDNLEFLQWFRNFFVGPDKPVVRKSFTENTIPWQGANRKVFSMSNIALQNSNVNEKVVKASSSSHSQRLRYSSLSASHFHDKKNETELIITKATKWDSLLERAEYVHTEIKLRKRLSEETSNFTRIV